MFNQIIASYLREIPSVEVGNVIIHKVLKYLLYNMNWIKVTKLYVKFEIPVHCIAFLWVCEVSGIFTISAHYFNVVFIITVLDNTWFGHSGDNKDHVPE